MKVLNIVNYKLIKRGYKSNLSIINNNINKDYEITNRNISDFSWSFYWKGVLYGKEKEINSTRSTSLDTSYIRNNICYTYMDK